MVNDGGGGKNFIYEPKHLLWLQSAKEELECNNVMKVVDGAVRNGRLTMNAWFPAVCTDSVKWLKFFHNRYHFCFFRCVFWDGYCSGICKFLLLGCLNVKVLGKRVRVLPGTTLNPDDNLPPEQTTNYIQLTVCLNFVVLVKDLVEKREMYKHRIDKLESKVHNMTTGLITEFFAPGRLDCLKGWYPVFVHFAYGIAYFLCFCFFVFLFF